MVVTNILPRDIIVQLELTLSEIDDISLALSKATVITSSSEEVEAQKTLINFSNLLNTILDKCDAPELQRK